MSAPVLGEAMSKRRDEAKTLVDQFIEAITVCPRCKADVTTMNIIEGRCSECRLSEEEADWADEDEADGGSPWGR